MKPFRTHGFSQIPRLRDIESETSGGGSEFCQRSSSQEDGTEKGESKNVEDIERLLNETKKSLLASQKRSAELEREEARAKFDLEDAQLRYSTAQKQVSFGFIIVAVGSHTRSHSMLCKREFFFSLGQRQEGFALPFCNRNLYVSP